ncbi:MAG TPA: RagB/SusD family nutrient uptake outer membrane protein, partial [Puia sp.]|nr:RagB/SusD family nutrient uptake outer membrane protein [Puia sp.]
MKPNIIYSLIAAALSVLVFSCKKDFGNLNGPTVESYLGNASASDLNNLVTGTESGMRNAIAFYLDDVSTIGREIYHFSASEPRYVTDLLGADAGTLSNSNFYITTPWAAAYRVVKNCNLLIDAAGHSTLITDSEKHGYTGFARTIKAYQLLLNLNLTDSNGIRLDVSDPDHLGPIVSYDDALTGILAQLDSGKTDLTGATIDFQLSAGFAGFSDADGLIKFNRALAARVQAYRGQWADVLTALGESFFGLNKPFNLGIYHTFSSASGDQLNPVFIPQNQAGDIRVAHPSYATDILSGDDRISKTPLRQNTASLAGLSSNRDVFVYTSSTDPVTLIRNEELILLYAEASIQTSQYPDAVTALNVIRNGHNLAPYAGALTSDALIDEMLYERRYSLFFEGHRWVDLRRYNRLNELPIDRPND